MTLPLSARVYLSLVVVSAIAFMAYWLQAWRGPSPGDLGLLAVLAVLALAATRFPLKITPRCKADVSIAVYFGALLLFGVPAAMALAGVCQLAGGFVLGPPGFPLLERLRRSLRGALFNASQLMIALGLGGSVYYSLLPQMAPAPLSRPENLWAIPAAAITIYLANGLAVALMVALHLGQSLTEVWLPGRRLDALQFAGLFLIGFVTALTSVDHPWAPLAMVLPTALIYLSLKRTVELMEQTVSAVEAMADVVDMRDHYTFEHSKRVADYAVRIARRMRLPGDEIRTIGLFARVHDLGKMGVPDQVLLKPGKLTSEEWEIMKRHPQMGCEVLSRFPQYRQGKELVLWHHERFDGKGYPNGLRGNQLSVAAQIIAVADAFEAMTSDRPYRLALSLEDAMAEFRRLKGTQWQPEVVEALESLVNQQDSRLPIRAGLALSA